MKHNIFALELCLRMTSGNTLGEELRQLVKGHPAATTPGQKWELLKQIARLLLDNQDHFVKGCWDFFDDDGRALKDYDMWSNGMITEEGARTLPSGRPGGKGSEPRYMTFTIALLLVADSPCARDLSRLCAIPEEQLWRRSTFIQILRGLKRVSFASVKSDVLYLIPGDEEWGLTDPDLEHSKFEYLRPIV